MFIVIGYLLLYNHLIWEMLLSNATTLFFQTLTSVVGSVLCLMDMSLYQLSCPSLCEVC